MKDILIRKLWLLINLSVSVAIALLVSSYKEELTKKIEYIIIWSIYINIIICLSVQYMQEAIKVFDGGHNIKECIKKEYILTLLLILSTIIIVDAVIPVIIKDFKRIELLFVLLTGIISLTLCFIEDTLILLYFKKKRFNYRRDGFLICTLSNQLSSAFIYYNFVIYYI